MKTRLEELLPLVKNGQLSKNELEQLLSDLRKAINAAPESGRELGRYIAEISNAIKASSLSTGLNWLKVGGGLLAIGHKPGGKVSFETLKKEGATTLVTLLQEKEGAVVIGGAAKRAGLEWLWLPFSANTPPAGPELTGPLSLFKQLQSELCSGGGVYIHCSAGIHRTGMVTYALLRYLGYHQEESLQLLGQLRQVTADQVGGARLSWGDYFAIHPG